jgi:sulfotransferase family protein
MLLNRLEITARLFRHALIGKSPLVRTRLSAGPRRFHAFGVSVGRSGTQSIARIFSNYRAVHEPFYSFTWYVLAESGSGKLDTGDRRYALRMMDALMRPEISSAFFFNELLEDVMALYPDARFILSIRDCYSWLNSMLDTGIPRAERVAESAAKGTYYAAQRYVRMRPDLHPHPPEESLLKEYGLFSLDSYLGYWATRNQKVLDLVPADRLLILRTRDIGQSAAAFADFLKIDPETLVMERSHANQMTESFNIMTRLDRAHLEAKIEQHCRPLMDRFYPEIKTLDDTPFKSVN